MKNVERIARHITKNGAENILVHTIPGTNQWITCYKVENDRWMLTLCNPMGNVTYNLGTVTNNQHIQLWTQLITMEIEKNTSPIIMANKLRETIHRFTKDYENHYKKFIKKEQKKIGLNIKTYPKILKAWEEANRLLSIKEIQKPSKTKQQRLKLRKKSNRSKKPAK